ncbi:MAG: DUF1080 domain-containing protein [Planctomycetales bacterium]|nr:DUF1080 domain-containing protein [Planctomycetales bacterium]
MTRTTTIVTVWSAFATPASAWAGPSPLAGDWSFRTPSNEVGWLSVDVSGEGPPRVQLLWAVGSVRELPSAELHDGILSFQFKHRQRMHRVEVRADGDDLHGVLLAGDGDDRERRQFHGRRQPPLPDAPPLQRMKMGERIRLFNGEDLTGWKVSNPDKKQGWTVEQGVLKNVTPKTDFGAYGDYTNLQTEREFRDFQLHIEFRVPANGNSGIYLRGMYEAQVVDKDSMMQGIHGPGAIFGRIKPSVNAGLPGGQWQSYDLTLVARHITVVLNNELVIDRQPVRGPTGGAIVADVTKPGPIYLQGDHTAVEFRNILLTPIELQPDP